MGALTLSSVSLPSLLQTQHQSSSLTYLFSDPIATPFVFLKSSSFRSRRETTVLVTKSNGPKELSFLDDESGGGVDDMDGFLNSLSLEYDSVWDTKPSWCQPWTITLAGASVVACSWLTWHSTIFTAVVLALICIWWYIFLYSYPKEYSNMIAERKRKVSSGHEDTYGVKKGQ